MLDVILAWYSRIYPAPLNEALLAPVVAVMSGLIAWRILVHYYHRAPSVWDFWSRTVWVALGTVLVVLGYPVSMVLLVVTYFRVPRMWLNWLRFGSATTEEEDAEKA